MGFGDVSTDPALTSGIGLSGRGPRSVSPLCQTASGGRPRVATQGARRGGRYLSHGRPTDRTALPVSPKRVPQSRVPWGRTHGRVAPVVKLKRVRVTNYKSVLDAEWFTVGDLTCLVGKNESGKTALLEAVERLNSVRSERSLFRETEYPRMNWSEYEESPDVDVAVFSEWELGQEE